MWTPSFEERQDAVLYAGNVQNFMALELGVPVTTTSNKILRKVGGPFDLSQVAAGAETPGRQPLLADSSPD